MTTPSQNNQSGLRVLPDFFKIHSLSKTNYQIMNTLIKPILFSTEMVQSLINGTKTQTRRILKPQPKDGYTPKIYKGNDSLLHLESRKSRTELEYIDWKVIQPGTVLWVRETFMKDYFGEGTFAYKASFTQKDELKKNNSLLDYEPKWKPSLFMPKDAARLFLKVKSIKVERLQDISNSDAIAEGIYRENYVLDESVTIYRNYGSGKDFYSFSEYSWNFGKENHSASVASYCTLWEEINGEGSWNSNPWVWVIEFEQVEKPENFL